jgi:hypothetical protein
MSSELGNVRGAHCLADTHTQDAGSITHQFQQSSAVDFGLALLLFLTLKWILSVEDAFLWVGLGLALVCKYCRTATSKMWVLVSEIYD